MLQVYSESAAADRAGHSAQFRRQTLVPAIVEDAYDGSALSEDELAEFAKEMEAYAQEWDQFQPATAFQEIVCDCINKICV